MSEQILKVNALPNPTYNWLRMNEADVEFPAEVTEANPTVTHDPAVTASAVRYEEMQDIAGGMGYDMDLFIKNSGISVLKLSTSEGSRIEKPIHIDYTFRKEDETASAVYIDAADNSSLIVVEDFRSDDSASGFAAVQTKIRIGKNASVMLIQVHHTAEDFRLFNDIGTVNAEEGRFEQIELFLSGKTIYQGSRTDLSGKNSSLKTDIGYLLKGEQHLDMNYIANHIGKRTTCDIHVDGVLRDEAFKLFRGTIDLRKGAKGAIGNEMEDVLLMDDTIVNQTIPIILCDEEDVEGNHGATIGRIDDELMFYLTSRGMTKEEVYEMMAEARIDAVINKIPDAETRNAIYMSLKGHGEVKFLED